LVSLPDIALSVFIPGLLNFFVQVEIELAVNNCPGFRINICRGPTAYGIGSVAPVLWGILFRILLEKCEMLLAGEKPLRILPFLLKIFLPFNRMAKGEVGDSIVALEGDSVFINIDGSRWGSAGKKSKKTKTDKCCYSCKASFHDFLR